MLIPFLKPKPQKPLGAVAAIFAVAYTAIMFNFPVGDRTLFVILIATQIYYVWQILAFIYTVWGIGDGSEKKVPAPQPVLGEKSVDVFITVAGEPIEVIEKTVIAAKNMKYGASSIYILNDGFVAKKDNWREVENLAERLGVRCITRQIPGGAKAGNLNHALGETAGELVAVFDADHVPRRDFLRKTTPYFEDPGMGFVQTPQYYHNFGNNIVTGAAWDQQKLFFGPLMIGKNSHNAVIMCGTNMVVRRTALMRIGGFVQDSIAEDFLTGLRIHTKGYRAAYVPVILARGLAPFDLVSYTKQQFRWARGSLEALIKHNPLFVKGLTLPQRIEYFGSATYFLVGTVILVTASLPLIFFATGNVPLQVSGMALASVFIPYMICVIVLLNRVSNGHFRFLGAAFSVGSFWVHLEALLATLIRRKSGFVVTPKSESRNSGLSVLQTVWPHIAYAALAVFGFSFALAQQPFGASMANNAAWTLWHMCFFYPFVRAAVAEVRPQTFSVRLPERSFSWRSGVASAAVNLFR